MEAVAALLLPLTVSCPAILLPVLSPLGINGSSCSLAATLNCILSCYPITCPLSPPGIKGSGCNANEFFYRESLAAGSLDQLPAPLERIPADA